MSTCATNFIKVSIPVDKIPEYSDRDDKMIEKEYVYDDGGTNKINMCVKKCNSGSIPMNLYNMNPDKKFMPTLQNITNGANLQCNDNASTESTNNTVTYKCMNGLISLRDPQNPKCIYTPNQYPIKN